MDIECYPENGSNNGTVDFIAYNSGRSASTKTIRVKGEGVPVKTVSVRLAGKPVYVQLYGINSILPDQTSLTIHGVSNAIGLSISVNSDTIGLSGRQYVVNGSTYNSGDAVTGDPGLTNEYDFTITFTFGQNTGLLDKSATVTVSDIDSGVSTAIMLTQKAIAGPGISLDSNTGIITMTNPFDTGDIFYTIDGTTPTSQSRQYGGPFIIQASNLLS